MIEELTAREIFYPHADWRNALPSLSLASLATLAFRDLESIHYDKIPAFDCLHAPGEPSHGSMALPRIVR